jgi:hypothetical protein
MSDGMDWDFRRNGLTFAGTFLACISVHNQGVQREGAEQSVCRERINSKQRR